MKLMKYISIAVIASLILGGCGGGGGEKKQQQAQSQQKSGGKSKTQSQSSGSKAEAKIMTAHYLSEAIEGTSGIKHATVIIKDKDAYVAVEMQNKQELMTEDKKNLIVQRLRNADPEIGNVYISTNADFNSKMGTMTRDMERGTAADQVNAFFDDLVRNTFPELSQQAPKAPAK